MLYRLEVKEPPAASSGKVYNTVEARCFACVVNQGSEEPCLPADHMTVRQKQTGRPCPFVSLATQNMLPAQLISCLIADDTKPIAALLAQAAMDEQELDASERVSLLSRVRSTLHNRDIVDVLHPPIEKAHG